MYSCETEVVSIGFHVPGGFSETSPLAASSSTIQRLSGSIRNIPLSPFVAVRSISPKTSTYSLPESSKNPPLPDWLPPLASTRASGSKSAAFGEYTTTWPPSPLVPAFAVVRLSPLRATTSPAQRSILPPSPVTPSALIVPNWPTRMVP
ncbi:hypothetical protein ES703_06796 [subsurface metagenome]